MESILLEVPRTIDWKEHSICRVIFYDPTLGRLTCRCSLSSPLILPDQMLSIRCEIVEKLSQEQRRNDVKVPVGTRVLLRIPHRPGDAPVPPEGWQNSRRSAPQAAAAAASPPKRMAVT